MRQPWRVAFGDPKIGPIARQHLDEAVARNWASEGENVKKFERLFAEKFGYKHAIATSSGTDADICAAAVLHDFGAQRGDEILTPACAFIATANSILAAGFTPKFVDIEVDTLNLDPKKLEAAIGPRTRAIQAVHTMGKPCEMDTILALAKKHNLFVIEDACEAHGAKYKGKVVGTIGDMGAFSFFAAHLVYSGEGGMIVTNRDDLEAALGIEGVINFDETYSKRKKNVARLLELTKDLEPFCWFLKQEPYEDVSPHAFPLVLKNEKHDRDALYALLESKGIQCKTLFGCLPTQHRALAFLGHKPGDFPAAEYVGRNGLHFGCHQGLSDADLVYVSEQLHAYFGKFR